MRFLSMIRVNENSGLVPSARLMSDMGRLVKEMSEAGVLLDTAGLRPTIEGVRIRLAHGKLTTTDGPFAESKEVIGGYAMIQAATREEAIDWTSRFLKIHGDEWDIECELRQVEEVVF
ncbi:MAG: YciI family protein [Pseudoxanthomonas sp.]